MVRKSLLAASLVLTCAAAVSAVGGAAQAAQAPAAAPAACSSSAQTIDLAALTWQPPAVFPGQSSVATATAINCTTVTQTASAEWLGRFVGPGTGLPAGCPVIDPLITSLTLPPGASATSSVGYLVPGGCSATGLIVTVKILQNGVVVSSRSAELIIK